MEDIQKKVEDINEFWFKQTSPKQKFQKDDSFDELIRDRFLDIYWGIVKTRAKGWTDTAEACLAAIVVLDQFSRNMFRGDKQSFAEDELALSIAQKMINEGYDKKIPIEIRSSVYMPFMHSESKEIHKKALELFSQYAKESGNDNSLKYEIDHKAIIDKFGRFPHRNEILGRQSSEEEKEFHKIHGGY